MQQPNRLGVVVGYLRSLMKHLVEKTDVVSFERHIDGENVRFFNTIHVAATLLVEITMVGHPIWCLDMRDVATFSDVGGILVRCTHSDDTVSNTAHRFQLRDFEVKNRPVPSKPPACDNDGVLESMEFTKGFA